MPEGHPSASRDHRHLRDDEENETCKDDPEGLRARDPSPRDVGDGGEAPRCNENRYGDLAKGAETASEPGRIDSQRPGC